MNKEELKKWFITKLNSCYPVTHDDYSSRIFWIYDESFVRYMKLSKINNTTPKNISKISGDCLFEQDTKNNYLFCNYSKIWLFFESNYNSSFVDIQIFINNILCNVDELKIYKPYSGYTIHSELLNDNTKLKHYKTTGSSISNRVLFLEQNKIKHI